MHIHINLLNSFGLNLGRGTWKRVRIEVRPSLHVLEQSVAGTWRFLYLAMGNELYRPIQVDHVDSALDQHLERINLLLCRQRTFKIAEKCNAQDAIIHIISVFRLHVPASALVHHSVAADREICVDIIVTSEEMGRLQAAHLSCTAGMTSTWPPVGMMNQHDRWFITKLLDERRIAWRTGDPTTA